ncbi:hypothetical protein GJM84_24620 [Vibrio parahaemolyticus]|nr:hypothetical protein [Vibrio parahaemolyticus]EGQ8932520.1 hypothetical protein [Vibrio parahaemolyticus]EGQ8977116.1 hypothetical protein [Vibrio parahaemolyticus]EGQ8981994.1 hypothetical protein [Vibrio parahaemolyticus]EGQ9001134.1 hypothetical protein [Vibrio parahaemolyticus]
MTHINIHLACKKASESFSPHNSARHSIQSIEIEIEIEIEKQTGYVFPLQACVVNSFVRHCPTLFTFRQRQKSPSPK